jgi:tRNA-2-methylthio-N6-dimethylallyladenosine synthase
LPNQIPDRVARERLHRLQALIEAQAQAFDQGLVGQRLPVLIERKGRKPGQIAGRSPYLQAVHGEGPEHLIGDIVAVDIVSAGPNSLTGVIKSEFEWREPVQAAV